MVIQLLFANGRMSEIDSQIKYSTKYTGIHSTSNIKGTRVVEHHKVVFVLVATNATHSLLQFSQ